jgi:hypothetical protein
MKVIIDLIEDIRETIANQEAYTLHAMLLKEDQSDSEKLIYAGEAPIGSFVLDDESKQLVLSVEREGSLQIGELLKHLLILSMDMMMYEVRLHVNLQHDAVEVVGFGQSGEDKKYILFIKPKLCNRDHQSPTDH